MATVVSHLALAAVAAASLTAVTACVPSRSALIQPACLLLCQANDSPVSQGDETVTPPPDVAPIPKARRK